MKRQKSELTKIISIICSIVIILVATIPAAMLIGAAVSGSSTIVFEAGESYVAPISGTPGTKAELPANVAIVGKTFDGWYTDAGFTKPAGDNYKFPKADTVDTLYAKMVIENGTLVTFDDMPNELITNPGGKFHTSGCYSIAKNTGINGTAALKRDSYTSNEAQEKYTALNSGNDFLKLSANSVYKFSFNYYVEKTDTTSLYPCLLTSGDNHWNGYKRWLCTSLDGTRSDNNGVPGNAIDISETGVWKKVDFFVSTKNIDSGMNYAYIGFQGANKAVFYVDNIEVVRVAETRPTPRLYLQITISTAFPKHMSERQAECSPLKNRCATDTSLPAGRIITQALLRRNLRHTSPELQCLKLCGRRKRALP